VHKLNLTAVPTDRPPFPLPEGITVSAYFTVQPGRAYLSKGAQIVYPNYHDLPAGQRVDFWNYDPKGDGWYVYGKGEVTRDGTQIVPDRDVRVWEFTGAMAATSSGAPGEGENPEEGADGGDPVDLATGLFNLKQTDLVVDDAIPAALTRSYRPDDANNYGFGRGTSTPWDLRMVGFGSSYDVRIVFPAGGSIRYTRPQDSTERVFKPVRATGAFGGSVLAEVAGGSFELRLRGGTVYEFGNGLPVRAIRDRFGNRLTITRDRASGPPVQVTTPNGRWLKFTLDTSSRITEARDNVGRTTSPTLTAASRGSSTTPTAR
jgi:YD repeat-containing protein